MTLTLPAGDVLGYRATLGPQALVAESALRSNLQDFTPAGRHWRWEVRLRGLTDARLDLWAGLEEAGSQTFLWPLPQRDTVLAAEGAPRVDGGGQLGRTLQLRGLAAGYVIPVRTWISVLSAGRRYCYRTSAAVTADGAGAAAVPLYPNIRALHSDDDVVAIAAPLAEGRVQFDGFDHRQGGAAPARFIFEERG